MSVIFKNVLNRCASKTINLGNSTTSVKIHDEIVMLRKLNGNALLTFINMKYSARRLEVLVCLSTSRNNIGVF